MIAVDTNVLVRFLTADDEAQYRKASRIFKNNDVFIPDTVILEAEWVLRYAYKFKSEKTNMAFTRLLGLENVHAANPNVMYQVLSWHLEGMDFADALHLAASQHCDVMVTFDEALIKKAKAKLKCKVKKP